MSGLNEQFLQLLPKKVALLFGKNTFHRENTFKENLTLEKDIIITKNVRTPDAGELTIATGAITVTGAFHTIDTQSDASSDDLDTINGMSDGQIVEFRAENAARSVVVKHNTGNILTFDGGDLTLDETRKLVKGRYDAALDKVLVQSSGVQLLDEDNMASDSATKGATQQSIKAYADTKLSSVSQGNLNTSTGTVNTASTTIVNLTLPGGGYGFYPQIKNSTGGTTAGFGSLAGDGSTAISGITTSFLTLIGMLTNTGTITAQQRYVTASPPYDMGDGEVGGFIFLLMNKDGTIAASYMADVPPWAYNGPTNIRADKIDLVTGKKYRKVCKTCTPAELFSVKDHKEEYEEITQAIKNADMNLIPHPFASKKPNQTVVLLDPMDENVKKLIDYQNAGGDIQEYFTKGLIYTNDTILKRKGPRGVKIMPIRFK